MNQNNGFQNYPTNPTPNTGFSNSNFGQQPAPNYTSGQFQSPQQQPNNSGFGFVRPATNPNYNPNTNYSQNPPNNQAQPNNGFYSTGFGQQGVQNQQQQPIQNSGQFYQPRQTQPLQNGYGQQQQQQRSVTVGQNGWPEINTKINTGDVIKRGVETTAEMLRRAYDSNVQPR